MSKNNNTSTRISPNSIDAEKAVLGCILINPDAISKSIQIIDDKDFYNKANRIIYENMLQMTEENKQIDYITILEYLKKNNQLNVISIHQDQ